MENKNQTELVNLGDLFTAFPRDTSISVRVLFNGDFEHSGWTNFTEKQYIGLFPIGRTVQLSYGEPDQFTLVRKIKLIQFNCLE